MELLRELLIKGARRRGAALTLAALVVFAPAFARASNSGPDDGDTRDWATGSATVLVDVQHPDAAGNGLSFDATTLPGSAGAQGKIQYFSQDLNGQGSVLWQGHVDCVVVHDNEATIGGSIDNGSNNGLNGRFALRVRDNPTRDEEQGDPVLLRAGGATAGDCTNADFTVVGELSVAKGDVTVHDHSA